MFGATSKYGINSGVVAGVEYGGIHLIINDIDGARWALGTGSYDLTFYKHKSDTDTWEEALRLEGNAATNVPLGVTVSGFVRPKSDNSYDLGSSSLRWKNGYLMRAYLYGQDEHLHLLSSNTDWGWKVTTHDYGGGNVPLQIYKKAGGSFTEALRVMQDGHLLPMLGNQDLGSSTYKWRNGYFAGELSVDGGVTTGGDLLHSSGNAKIEWDSDWSILLNLGGWSEVASYKTAHVCSNVYYNKAGTLNLIDTGKPSWILRVSSDQDNARISRAPAGSTAYTDLLKLDNAGNLTIRGNIYLPGSASIRSGRIELDLWSGDYAQIGTYHPDVEGILFWDRYDGKRLYIDAGSLRIGGTEVINSSRNLVGLNKVAQSLLPSSSGSYDLGSSDYLWQNLYLSNVIKFRGAAGGTGGIQYLDSGGSLRYGLLFPGGNIVALCNRAANGVVQIRANTSSAGSAGEVVVAQFEDDKVVLYKKIYGENGASIPKFVQAGVATLNTSISAGSYTTIMIDFSPNFPGTPRLVVCRGADDWITSRANIFCGVYTVGPDYAQAVIWNKTGVALSGNFRVNWVAIYY